MPRRMSVAEALNELKLLDARINRIVSSTTFVASSVGDARINGRTQAEFNRDAQSAWDSFMDLQRQRTVIKAAITMSNATTHVEVAGQRMTVAEAIEYRKHGITYKRNLLHAITNQWANVNSAIERNNTKLRETALARATEATKAMNPEDANVAVNNIVRSTMERDGMRLVNPIDLAQKTAAVQSEVESFDSAFDLAINTSNYITFIEV